MSSVMLSGVTCVTVASTGVIFPSLTWTSVSPMLPGVTCVTVVSAGVTGPALTPPFFLVHAVLYGGLMGGCAGRRGA